MPHTAAEDAFTRYAAQTSQTAIYPHVDSGHILALAYVALGLGGEAAEVYEKELVGDIEGLHAELGDVAWFLGRAHAELGLPVRAADGATGQISVATAGEELLVATSKFQEQVSKAIRDDASELTESRRATLTAHLAAVVVAWFEVAGRHDFVPQQVLDRNLSKLLDRRDRGVLTGSGDYR